MKKTVSLILVFMLCMLLISCSMKPAEVVVGEWAGTYTWQGSKQYYNGKELDTGDTLKFTMSIFKGGAVEIVRENPEKDYKSTHTGTWEISDGVLVVACPTDVVISWEINTDVTPETLNMNGSNIAFPKTLIKEK